MVKINPVFVTCLPKRRFVRRKGPKWFVANVNSNPSSVNIFSNAERQVKSINKIYLCPTKKYVPPNKFDRKYYTADWSKNSRIHTHNSCVIDEYIHTFFLFFDDVDELSYR